MGSNRNRVLTALGVAGTGVGGLAMLAGGVWLVWAVFVHGPRVLGFPGPYRCGVELPPEAVVRTQAVLEDIREGRYSDGDRVELASYVKNNSRVFGLRLTQAPNVVADAEDVLRGEIVLTGIDRERSDPIGPMDPSCPVFVSGVLRERLSSKAHIYLDECVVRAWAAEASP